MEHKESKDNQEIVIKADDPEAKELRILMRGVSYSGPLPPPAQLEKYNQIAPGAAKKIIQHMMDEQKYRHEISFKSLDLEGKEALRGQWMGFCVTLTALLSALICAYLGAYWVAGVFLAAPIAGIVHKFIDGKN